MAFKEHYSKIPPTCMMMWRPISRKCWTLAPSRSCTVHGLARWYWSKRRTGAWEVLYWPQETEQLDHQGCLLATPHWGDPQQPAGVPMVLLTQPEVRVLAGWDGQGEQAADHIYHWATGVLWMQYNALWADQCPYHLSAVDRTCLWDLNLNWCVIYLDDIVIFQKI